jgi:hypothetical protein
MLPRPPVPDLAIAGCLATEFGSGGGVNGALPAVQPHRRATRSRSGLFIEHPLYGNVEVNPFRRVLESKTIASTQPFLAPDPLNDLHQILRAIDQSLYFTRLDEDLLWFLFEYWHKTPDSFLPVTDNADDHQHHQQQEEDEKRNLVWIVIIQEQLQQ